MKIATHPGAVLQEDYLEPLNITQADFARSIGISLQRVNEIVNEKRGVTPETAKLFAQAFETSPEFWMNLQTGYDLAT
jgi:antitoxin HigA-1